ncbi:hypothetical protein BDV25DRAFT_105764 [Aspergillus avenaceus]|uniref:LIM zinc-binding domain-containing protein n=1 Tax=Aspergillus avenaceus TaxID=36643 RepID=A0A5N6TX34_ASPAV|nr:hypothetical protein BDV25DRAFT_105764 [Aspergillus avenaceus]
MSAGMLPMIKCSNCGSSVEISEMGDHVCPPTPATSSATPPPPPPKSSSPRKSLGRSGPPAPIDPSRANRPFMRLEAMMSAKSNVTPSGSQRSPPRPLLRSQTSPLPAEPQSPDEVGIPQFPLPRSMSQKQSSHMIPLATEFCALPVPNNPGGNQRNDRPLASVRLPLGEEAIAPSPLPKDDVMGPLPTFSHKHSYSTESRSSYRTSVASSRYDSRRSASLSLGRPSLTTLANQYKDMDDVPPVPSIIPRNLLRDSTASTYSEASTLHSHMKHDSEDRGRSHAHLGTSTAPANQMAEEAEQPGTLRPSSHTSSERLSSNRGSAELFFRSPTPSSRGTPSELPDLPEERSVSPAVAPNIEYRAYKSPTFEPPRVPSFDSTSHNGSTQTERRASDATSEGGLSISNFARALGLDHTEITESSTTSSDSSPSDTRSGTSMSSIASDASTSRRKPSDQGRLGSVVEDIQRNDGRTEAMPMDSPETLEPPRMLGHWFSPDSPTDPAISTGSVALISDLPKPEQSKEQPKEPREEPIEQPKAHLEDQPVEQPVEQPKEQREEQPRDAPKEAPKEALPQPPATSPSTERARPAPRPKGPCRGCNEMIFGKSVSSADGRLTGRYHRACFVCYDCKTPFQTADFYVLEDLPYCAQHYHQRNGSLCQTCRTGIEGQYLETLERRGRGPADRHKFHMDCLTCRTCQISLKGDYFEWNGQVYCERDARRAAAATPPPPRFQRPLMPPSPLAHHRENSRGYPRPPPPGYGRPGPGPRPPPSPGPGPGPRMGPPMGPPMGSPMGPPMGPNVGPNMESMGLTLGPGLGPGPYDGPYPDGARRFPERRTTKLMMI